MSTLKTKKWHQKKGSLFNFSNRRAPNCIWTKNIKKQTKTSTNTSNLWNNERTPNVSYYYLILYSVYNQCDDNLQYFFSNGILGLEMTFIFSR